MARVLYNCILYCFFPFLFFRMVMRSLKEPAYRRRLSERFGIFNIAFLQGSDVIWIHAASVGEVFVATPLIKSLLNQYSESEIVVTTTTPAGSALISDHFDGSISHIYLPFDLPGSVQRFLQRVKPKMLVLIEVELWPNLILKTKSIGCKIVLVNARLSAPSARRYAKYKPLVSAMLDCFDIVACQSEEDAKRFLSLGLSTKVLSVTGNMKFDLEIPVALESKKIRFSESYGLSSRFVIVAASTHSGEENIILESFAEVKKLRGDSLLILAPRHPEECERILRECDSRELKIARYSAKPIIDNSFDLLLIDILGELFQILGVADVAIIGGSFVPHGGHNMLEAAIWGVPIVTGTHTHNFNQIVRLLVKSGAMKQIESHALPRILVNLLKDETMRFRMGEAGREVVKENRGAKDRVLELLFAQRNWPDGC